MLENPVRFRILSLIGLLVILAIEALAVSQLSATLPAIVNADSSRTVLQSLIAFDGVLVGFGAIVFATLLGRATRFEEISYMLLSMAATVALYVISVMNALYGLAVSASGVGPDLIVGPWQSTVWATTVLFFTVYIHMVRSYLIAKPS